MITDIAALDALVQARILDAVDHTYLDADVPFLAGILSTVENLVQVFYNRLAPEMPTGARLYRVRVYESEQNWTDVTEEEITAHE
jgi:6-pyruvoyltetrahydropterin/6-carboxytetrahydropterin synthase